MKNLINFDNNDNAELEESSFIRNLKFQEGMEPDDEEAGERLVRTIKLIHTTLFYLPLEHICDSYGIAEEVGIHIVQIAKMVEGMDHPIIKYNDEAKLTNEYLEILVGTARLFCELGIDNSEEETSATIH